MSAQIAKADPVPMLDVEGYLCPVCTVELSRDSTFCKVCLTSRPMDRRGVPQIFAGFKMHFNGVFPRSLKHPSHAVEWRMAERHGACCLVEFDLAQTNLLIYRPGYERSEKVRKCTEGGYNIPAVPISWLLDCLLQSRQIHPALYRLASIPAVAQPTVRGSILPHHQHPYYLMNSEEYAIPTSFVMDKKRQKALDTAKGGIEKSGVSFPPLFELQELQYTNVEIFKAVCNVVSSKKAVQDVDEEDTYGEARETRKHASCIELLLCEQRHNFVDKLLFSGMKFMLTPGVESNQYVAQALKVCGGAVIRSSDGDIKDLLCSSVTHVIFDHHEKKCDLLVAAAEAKVKVPGLILAGRNWVEDCLMFGEIIPPYGPYTATEKLLATSSKKSSKR